MKTHRFFASFRVGHCFIRCESSAKVHGSFGQFLATQQHNQRARRAFLSDLTNHTNPEPESLSVEVAGHFIPIY